MNFVDITCCCRENADILSQRDFILTMTVEVKHTVSFKIIIWTMIFLKKGKLKFSDCSPENTDPTSTVPSTKIKHVMKFHEILCTIF